MTPDGKVRRPVYPQGVTFSNPSYSANPGNMMESATLPRSVSLTSSSGEDTSLLKEKEKMQPLPEEEGVYERISRH